MAETSKQGTATTVSTVGLTFSIVFNLPQAFNFI